MSDYKWLQASDGTGNAVLANITADRGTGSTVLQVDSTDKWPSEFIFTTGSLLPNNYIDPSTVTEMRGHIESGDIIIDGFEPGHTDTGNEQGQVALIKQTTGWANRVTELARVSHNDDGTLKDNIVSAAKLQDESVTQDKLAEIPKIIIIEHADIDSTGVKSFDVGYRPKLVRFTAFRTSASTSFAQLGLGTLTEGGQYVVSQRDTTSGNIAMNMSDSNCVGIASSTGNWDLLASGTITANGFELNVTTTNNFQVRAECYPN